MEDNQIDTNISVEDFKDLTFYWLEEVFFSRQRRAPVGESLDRVDWRISVSTALGIGIHRILSKSKRPERGKPWSQCLIVRDSLMRLI